MQLTKFVNTPNEAMCPSVLYPITGCSPKVQKNVLNPPKLKKLTQCLEGIHPKGEHRPKRPYNRTSKRSFLHTTRAVTFTYNLILRLQK